MPLVPIPISSYDTRVPPCAHEILNERLSAKLKLRGVYPVVFSITPRDDAPNWLGWCSTRIDSPDGELYLHAKLEAIPGLLLDAYLHELAHRLLRDIEYEISGHYWPFASMYAVLLRRVAGYLSEKPRIKSLTCYDVSQELEEHWGWAIQRALNISAELADQPISAEECAEKIWRIWFNETSQAKVWNKR